MRRQDPEQDSLEQEVLCSIRFQEDVALVQGCIAGSRGPWLQMVRQFEGTISFVIRQTLRVHQVTLGADALEDLIADFMVELVKNDHRRLRAYSGKCRLASWLKVVASNYTVDRIRKMRPMRSLDDDSPQGRALRGRLVDSAPDPEEAMVELERLRLFRALCERLPLEDRRFVELFFLQEKSFEEVAEQMQTSVGAVYARKNRVRKKLLVMIAEGNR